MATMNLSLPDSMKAFVEEQAVKEGFGTVSEYMRAVIRELQKRQAKQQLEAKLLEGLKSPKSRMTNQQWDELERQVRERSPELGEE
jgi:antitoxin ParD1/3/4